VVSFTAGDDMIWGCCQCTACQLSVQSHAVFPKKTKTRMVWNQFPWMIIYSYDHLLPPPILHLEEDQSPPWLISLCKNLRPDFTLDLLTSKLVMLDSRHNDGNLMSVSGQITSNYFWS
jgi:hypothetical protein